MSKSEEERLWMAYLDGELSASEASAFDAASSKEERDRLEAEVLLERGLAERPKGEDACPDALWRRTQLQIRNRPSKGRWLAWRPWVLSLGALAAVLLLTVAFVNGPPAEDAFAFGAMTVEDYAQTSEVDRTPEAVRAFLGGHGTSLQVAAYTTVHPGDPHAVNLLGAREAVYGGESLLEVMYNCCGYPAKVLIAPRESRSAAILTQQAGHGEVQRTKTLGDYTVAVVSPHYADKLADLFSLRTA